MPGPLTFNNFCSACAMPAVIFGHLNRSFYLLTYLLTPRMEDGRQGVIH